MKEWFAIALRPSVRGRALKVAAVIGSVLALINHWDAFLSGAPDVTVWTKIALTYLVPYCVSTYSSVEALRSRSSGTPPGAG